MPTPLKVANTQKWVNFSNKFVRDAVSQGTFSSLEHVIPAAVRH